MILLGTLFTLTLIASLFIAVPLWHTQTFDNQNQIDVNKIWYQQQLAELERSFIEKKITPELFEIDKLQLQKDFLSLSQKKTIYFKAKPQRIFALLLVIIFSLSSIKIYQRLGNYRQMTQQEKLRQNELKTDQEIRNMGGAPAIIRQLKQRLHRQPTDAQGWYLLGEIYFSQNNFKAAYSAYQKAVQLEPNREAFIIQLVESSYLSKNANTKKLLTQALQKMPQNPALLNLSALLLYQEKKYTAAKIIWQNLLMQVPKNSEAAATLSAAINQAHALEAS